MVSGGSTTTRSLLYTPTWALATVCFIFIFLSLIMEHLIHLLSNWLKRNRKTALFEAVEKLKSVLMVLGFMSLILTVTQRTIIKICIPTNVANIMLPCGKTATTKTTKALGYEHTWTNTLHNSLEERILAASETSTGSTTDYCDSKGMTSLISQDGLNQLNIFIFVIAVMQIVYSVITMALGRAKMRRWKAWERETLTVEYQVANGLTYTFNPKKRDFNSIQGYKSWLVLMVEIRILYGMTVNADPNRFRFTKQTTFGRRHMSSFTRTSFLLWTKCFFRQFFNSVAKVDYLTLRHGFISAHLSTNNTFDFQKYIQRSLEDDFKVVVGISPFMWFLVVIFILVDVHGLQVYLWISFLPLIIVLVLGTKLEVIVARMALQLKDRDSVIKGTPLVEPNDNLFWFSHPKYVLTLVHYTLFINAFELAFFVWVTLQYGIKSCYHESLGIILTRVVLAVFVQVLCSYITLPLYALVTQMGSSFKSAVLEEQTMNVIKQWHNDVKQKRKKTDGSQSGHDYGSTVSRSNRTIGSPDLYSHHHRTLPLSEINPTPSKTEILEDDQEVGHNEIVPDMVTPHVVQIEMPTVTKTQT